MSLSQIMKYYLADDTVELTETAQPNSGRDQLSTLLKRSKLPKDYLNSVASVATIGRVLDKVNGYYTMVRGPRDVLSMWSDAVH